MSNPSTKQNDAAAQKTEELCSLFSTTVSSLASDAVALNQIKSLAECCGQEENGNPNNAKNGLKQVDAIVTELEHKVTLLQEICAEEKQSLKDMESIKNAAEAQHELLNEMMQACDGAARQQEEEARPLVEASSHQKVTTATATPHKHQESIPTSHHKGLLRSGAKRVARRDSVDPREKRSIHRSATSCVKLDRVTQTEWNNVSKTVRGRITLAVVNDALRDIERVFEKKYAVLRHHHKSVPRKGAGQVELQQKLLNSHRELQVEEHGDDPWVSEQDLRQCCAFFRNGESTARAILLIIRTVRRLKQVPAKNSEVTYVAISSME